MHRRLVKRLGGMLTAAVLLLSGLPLYQYHVDTNAAYSLVFRYLAAPIGIGVLLLCARYLPGWRDPVKRVGSLLITLLLAAMAILVSGGYVTGFNAWVGKQETLELSGVITDLQVSHSRVSTAYHVTFEDAKTEEVRRLGIGEEAYRRLAVGDVYSQRWNRGSLGLLYSKR